MLSDETREFLTKFPYKAEDIISRLEGLRGMKVLVIGDTIIDQYHYCSSIGKSPKDNIIVVKYLGEESFAGGVLAAANHIAGFCDDVTLVTCLGKQETHEGFIRNHLKKNITPRFFYREDTSTIVKRRYIEPTNLSKMFGISFLDDYPLPEDVEVDIGCWLNGCSYYDLILVTDFGHGLMSDYIIDKLEEAHFLAVNSQTNTDNAGFNLITKYSNVDYLCLDEPEIRLACQSKYGEIEGIIMGTSIDFGCNKVAVTHGQYDTLMYDGGFYRIPVFSNGVRDTTGAGDAFLSISSLCVAKGFPMDLVGFIGNAVGALKVKIVCNRSSVEPDELYKFIRMLLNE